MIKNINDIYRNKISSYNSISSVLLYLSKLKEKELEYVLGILLADLYKISVYTHPFENNENIFKFFEIYDAQTIKRESSQFNYLLEAAISATMFFDDLNLINKVLLMEDIKDKDSLLSSLHELHILDKITYSFIYDLSFFIDLYKDFIDKEKKSGKLIIDFLITKFDDLKVINYDKYRKFILEFIKIYYKKGIYSRINSKDNKNFSYLKEIEEKPLKYLYNRVEKDDIFLSSILKNYLNYNIINEEIKNNIDNCFNNNSDKEIVKKLKFNDNKKTS